MNSDLERVWQQATEKKRPYTTINSEWTLDVGAKIEKFSTGIIVIHNTMVPGDNYTHLSTAQLEYFINNGWDAGRYKVCVDTLNERRHNAEYKDQVSEVLIDKITFFETKLRESLDSK